MARLLAACLLSVVAVGCSGTVVRDYGLLDSDVVCGSCSPEYLKAKTDGIMNALGVMVAQVGDINLRRKKVTFHLDMDKTCTDIVDSARASGMTLETTAFARCDLGNPPGVCDICFADATKQDLATAKSLAGQVLPLHEAGHAWWKGRKNLYNAEEPMVQMLSYALVGDAKFCTEHDWSKSGPPLTLVVDLCRAGITNAQIIRIHTMSAARAEELRRELTGDELAQIVSTVMGKDMRASFVTAGIITGS